MFGGGDESLLVSMVLEVFVWWFSFACDLGVSVSAFLLVVSVFLILTCLLICVSR